MDKEDLYEQYNEDPSVFIDKEKLKHDNSLYRGENINGEKIPSEIEKMNARRSNGLRPRAEAEAAIKRREASVEASRLYWERVNVEREEARLAQIEANRLLRLESIRRSDENRQRSEQLRLARERSQATYSGSGTGCILPVVFVASFFALLVLLSQLI